MLGEEHEIIAAALEREADSQEKTGNLQDDAYDSVLAEILPINDNFDRSVGFAFEFWDNWIDASNHDWLYHKPIKEDDWPKFAREVAKAVRRGELPNNQFLVDKITPKRGPGIFERIKCFFSGNA